MNDFDFSPSDPQHLLVFDEETLNQSLANFLENHDYEVDCCSKMEEALKLFEQQNYDYILINFMVNDGNKFMEHILSKNPRQRILTMSTTWLCSDRKGCKNCIDNYNKRRLMIPDDLNKLVPLLKSFDYVPCEYAFKVEQN